jgi:hypothetical protein
VIEDNRFKVNNVIQNIPGDYALPTWAEMFMKCNNDTAANDIARLCGALFVIAFYGRVRI